MIRGYQKDETMQSIHEALLIVRKRLYIKYIEMQVKLHLFCQQNIILVFGG